MAPVIIYITGFHQHAGKTVASLGIISQLKRYLDPARIGYFKPVGQELVTLPNGRKIDKDAMVISAFSGIPDIDFDLISPVRISSGFTREYLGSEDTNTTTLKLREEILHCVNKMAHKDIIIVEGTGHPGVGSIVGLSNAKVSNLMKAEIIYISGGGIGKALDMLEVDLSYFLYKKSRVRGVIFSKLIPDKIDTVKKYITEDLLNQRFPAVGGPIRILGFIPEIEALARPGMNLIIKKWPQAVPLGDVESEDWKRPCNKIKAITMPYADLRREFFLNPGDLLIMSTVYQKRVRSILKYNKKLKEGSEGLGGLILTSGSYISLNSQVKKEIMSSGLPAIYVKEDMAQTEELLLNIYENTKIQEYDGSKYKKVVELYEKYFDFERFIDSFGIKI